MKKLTAFLSVLIAICLLCSSKVFALTAPEQGTAVLDVDSVEPDDLAAYDSYVLTDNGENVLIVEHHNEVPGAKAALSDIADNGYYTAEFCIPNATKKVFLTGLTRNNVAEIEAAIIASYASGVDFELTNLGFIDTEKTGPEDDDDDLCWAAAASNILTYTGWAAQAGFDDEDDVFESLIDNFENEGGSTYYGIEWFFHGTDSVYYKYNGAKDFPRVLNYPDSGGFIADYTFETVTDSFEIYPDGVVGLETLLGKLKGGSGVELGIELYNKDDGSYSNGHAVTLWGFVTDTRYNEEDPEYYDSVFITDSDSDKYFDERRDSPDVMHLDTLMVDQDDDAVSYWFDIGYNYTALINDAVTLGSYRADLPKETDAGATRNRRTTPDAILDQPDVFTNTVSDKLVFPAGSTVYFRPHFGNRSDVVYSGRFSIEYTLTNSSGATVETDQINFGTSVTLGKQGGYVLDGSQALPSNLSAGVYTLTLSVNTDHRVSEAYYFNNTCTTTFSVGGAYLTGDVDDDDDVNTIDATLIMRKTAKFNVNLDDNAIIRGDINLDGDMDIVDATYIQRYLVEMTVPFDVNVRKRYS